MIANCRPLDTVEDDDCDEKTETIPGLGCPEEEEEDTDHEMVLSLFSSLPGDCRVLSSGVCSICSLELRGLLAKTVKR